MNRIRWAGAVAAFVLAACGGEAGEQPPPDTGAPQPEAPAEMPGVGVELPEGVTQEMVAQGKTVFETMVCFSCHGMDATGTALAPSLRDQDWLNVDGSYEDIMRVVREGVAQPVQYPAPMPPMGGAQLSDDQIRAVSAYVYAISRGG